MLLSFLVCNTAMAHDVEGLAKLSKTEVAGIYMQLGFTHILPLGLDHILFILCILYHKRKLLKNIESNFYYSFS